MAMSCFQSIERAVMTSSSAPRYTTRVQAGDETGVAANVAAAAMQGKTERSGRRMVAPVVVMRPGKLDARCVPLGFGAHRVARV
ncbi:hypothetical protein BVIET440_100023 [Burkholderia vietnamiensis]